MGKFNPNCCSEILTHGKNHVNVWKLLGIPKDPPETGYNPINGNKRQQKPVGTILRDKKGGHFDVSSL